MMLTEPLVVDKDGYIAVPQKPGLGVEINHELMDKYTVLLEKISLCYYSRRPAVPGMPSSSRYLATVRRDRTQPFCSSRHRSFSSDRG